MPNRFNDRENGESTNFPRHLAEHERYRQQQSWQSNPGEWRDWESEANEGYWGEQQRSHRFSQEGPEYYGSRSTGFRGEYGPAPRHTYRGRTIQESYGAYPGQGYQRGVYGYESPGSESYRGFRNPSFYRERRQYEQEAGPFDPNYAIGLTPQSQYRYPEEGWTQESYPEIGYEYGRRNFRRPEQGRFSGRGPRGYKRSDERIEEEINEILTRHPDLDATEILVQVQNCEVTLSGTAEDRYMKRLAEDIAESVPGVKEVQNQVRINRNFEQENESFAQSQGFQASTKKK